MAEMSMNKAIHGAVRRDLDRFRHALEAFPPGDLERAKQLGKAWANFDDQLTHHHEGEHEIAWPALAAVGVGPEVLLAMDAEHETMAGALEETRRAMRALQRTAGLEEVADARAAMERLRQATVTHLDHEEEALEDVFLARRDAPEIKEMGRRFGKQSPARAGRFFAWVMDGASPDEREAVTRNVPAPVLTVIGGVFGRGYRKDVAPVWRS